MKAQECKGVPNMNKPLSALTLRGIKSCKMETEKILNCFISIISLRPFISFTPTIVKYLTNRDAVARVPVHVYSVHASYAVSVHLQKHVTAEKVESCSCLELVL